PLIADRLGAREPSPPCDPEQSRLRLFDSVATFLRRAGGSEPIVVVLDDLHWADDGSIRLLAFVAPELRRSRTLLLATYREREMQRSRLLGEVARVSERITLRGLAPDEATHFTREAVDPVPPQPAVAQLHRVPRGNPFSLDEIVRLLNRAGRLERDDGDLAASLPAEVRHVIRRNLEPL